MAEPNKRRSFFDVEHRFFVDVAERAEYRRCREREWVDELADLVDRLSAADTPPQSDIGMFWIYVHSLEEIAEATRLAIAPLRALGGRFVHEKNELSARGLEERHRLACVARDTLTLAERIVVWAQRHEACHFRVDGDGLKLTKLNEISESRDVLGQKFTIADLDRLRAEVEPLYESQEAAARAFAIRLRNPTAELAAAYAAASELEHPRAPVEP